MRQARMAGKGGHVAGWLTYDRGGGAAFTHGRRFIRYRIGPRDFSRAGVWRAWPLRAVAGWPRGRDFAALSGVAIVHGRSGWVNFTVSPRSAKCSHPATSGSSIETAARERMNQADERVRR